MLLPLRRVFFTRGTTQIAIYIATFRAYTPTRTYAAYSEGSTCGNTVFFLRLGSYKHTYFPLWLAPTATSLGGFLKDVLFVKAFIQRTL